jgi:large subunit ribosomal protein L13
MSYATVNTGLSQTKRDLTRSAPSAKAVDIRPQWILIDAENLILGRLASVIANRLRGKHIPQVTPHVDCGDRVVVVNAEKIALTGKKMEQDTVYRHTGFPGGIKSRSTRSILEGPRPHERLEKAVWGMMPRGALSRERFRKHLYVYSGPSHPHTAQQPLFFDVASLNRKNVKGQNVAQPPGIRQEISEAIEAAFVPLKRSLLASEQAIIASEKAITETRKDVAESKVSLVSTEKDVSAVKGELTAMKIELTGMKGELTAIRGNTDRLVAAMEQNTAAILALSAKIEPK